MWFTSRLETYPGKAGRVQWQRTGARATPRGFARAAARALRCRRGVYALEFSFVVIPFFLMLLGSMELAWRSVTAVAVENAILRASRAGALGCLQPDGTRAGQAGPNEIKAAARAGGAGLLNGNALELTTKIYSSLAAANADRNGTSGAAGPGLGGQTVVYRLTYNHPYMFVGALVGNPTYAHSGIITIKNEPFNNAGASATACS